MSFGSSVRFEVKDGGKGGIFWQKEKPKQKPRKYGYKTKELRHTIRKPEPEYIEEPAQKPKKPSRDFIKKNREQYRMQKRDDDKENHRSNSASTGRPSSEIKAGTVTLTQDQLNALLATVGKLKPGEGGSLRISIDAENNRLQVETPRDNSDSVPNSSHSDTGDQRSVQGESSIFDLTKNSKSTAPPDNRDSSGYGSEEKSHGGKEVRFDSARNEERHKTPEAPSVPPPLVPWRHMTLGERKRLQWAREKAAAEEEEKKKQKAYDPWGRPGAGAPQKKPESDSQEDSQFRTKEEEKLRKAIDEIESKYGSLLKQAEKEPSQSAGGRHENRADRESDKTDSAAIPGLDVSYDADSGPRDNKPSKNRKQLEDKGNSRPPRKQDKGEERKSRGEDRKNKGDRNTNRTGQRQEEEKERQARVERKKKEKEEDERVLEALEAREEARQKAASMENSAVAPAAMQTSLFIGQAEPDNTRFLSKKEEEKRRWLEELDRQREEKRLQKQREKERQREGIDDTWADRFVTDGARRLPQSHPQQQQLPPPPYASGGVMERSLGQPQSSVVEQTALPPAAMRSAIAIGDTAPNLDKIELKQAEEKRLWLDELNKQREEQREARMRLKEKQRASEETWADRFTQDPRTAAVSQSPRNQLPSSYQDNQAGRINSAPQPAVNELDETKTHLRGQNVHVDPVTRREQEEKRRKHLEYQTAIKAQIEEKERLKREEREKKWREEAEEERKLKAERDALQRQLETEDSKNRQKEEARQRQVEHLKNMMDAEQERAQEQRMIKRLATLQQAGHDVSGLKAHYEAITPRFQQAVVDPASIPGLQASPRDNYGTGHSPRANPSGYWTAEGPSTMRNQEASTRPLNHEPYTENRVLTPSRFRQPSRPRSNPGSPQREFATQTDDLMELSNGLRKEMSEVEIEYRDRPTKNSNSKGGKNVRVKSAERKKPAENPRGRPPAPKQNRQKQQQQQQKGKPATWNYQNPQKRAPVKQSEKDPFYEQKRMESEERRAKRERQLQYLVELNKQVIPTEKQARPNHPCSQDSVIGDSDFAERWERRGDGHGSVVNGGTSHRSQSPPVNRTGKYRPKDRSRSPPVPTVRHNTGHNPARDYEIDYDTEAHNYHRPDPGFTPNMDERGNIKVPTKDSDFIPFTRTTDILDPSRAEEPIQLSRENTRIKQARQHYHENLRPADYGNHLDMYEDRQRQPAPRNKDPILNPGLVRDHPTARQDQILQQLSSLKQSLIQRQREIETCMSPSDLEKQV